MNAILAAILSLIIPGLGQALSGEVMRGVILFVIALIMYFIAGLIFKNWLAGIINIAIAVYAAYDAYQLNQ